MPDSKTEEEKVLLKWNETTGEFDPVQEKAGEGVFMELESKDSKWVFFSTKGASLIARRTALRSANGISKTGYVHPITKIRYGVECKLVEEEASNTNLPDGLRKSQRSWYEKK